MPNEGEFRAYHLMLLMGTHGKYKYNSTEYRKALKVGDTNIPITIEQHGCHTHIRLQKRGPRLKM